MQLVPQPSTLAIPPVDDLSGYSLPVQDIMGREPSWLLRSGAMIILFVFGLVLAVTGFVHYPDTIRGKAVITGSHPAATIIARQSGYLDNIRVAEKQSVQRGEILGFIRSQTDPSRALELRRKLAEFTPLLQDDNSKASTPPDFPPEPALGPLLPAYAALQARLKDYASLSADSFATATIANLRQQRQDKTTEASLIQQQLAAARTELALLNDQHQRLQRLFKSGAISDTELKAHQRQVLDQQRTTATIAQTGSANSIMTAEYDKQIAEQQHTRREDLRRSRALLTEAIKTLTAALDTWDNDYVLRSPVSGSVGFFEFWSNSQYVTAEKAVFIVTPESSELMARLPLSEGPLGKVKAGQRVVLRLNDYPSQEYGTIEGTVQTISAAAQKGGQIVQITIPNPLRTNHGKILPFKSEMGAEVSIITAERSLLARVFDQFRHLGDQVSSGSGGS